MRSERGQGTVEWVGTVLVVSLLMLALVTAGVRIPGASLAQELADGILCAATLADGCGDEPVLIAAYGTEVGKLVRSHMPTLAFEEGSQAVPVDFRRCRRSACGDDSGEGLVQRTDERLPVTAFVHVIDCREGQAEQAEADGADCSGDRAGNLYIQYWTYYADSAGFISSKSGEVFSSICRAFGSLILGEGGVFGSSGIWLRREISEIFPCLFSRIEVLAGLQRPVQSEVDEGLTWVREGTP